VPDHGPPEPPSEESLADRYARMSLAYERRGIDFVLRGIDIAIAGTALLVSSPLLVLIAAAILLTSGRPVLYRGQRVGRFGRLFTMYKFRTMQVDAEADGQAVWAQKNDPRTTSIGKFLRSTRLDELPQLVNVLKGDMNIVGPRPERPSIFAQLRNDIPQYAQRQLVKPGITGWAQINQSYDSCLDDVKNKVRYDLEYVQRRGVRHDLRIMSMTLPVMLLRNKGW
jgi:lipopolysaccharide/colanic/teichoic acid biosynthesis glycosyltransferase